MKFLTRYLECVCVGGKTVKLSASVEQNVRNIFLTIKRRRCYTQPCYIIPDTCINTFANIQNQIRKLQTSERTLQRSVPDIAKAVSETNWLKDRNISKT